VQKCTTSHHHALVKTVKPGDIYVAKSPTTAFVTPSIPELVIDAEFLADWRALFLTLPEWNKKLFLASTAQEDAPVSTTVMEVNEEFFHTKALNFKTPANRKRGTDDEDSPAPSLLDVSVYSPFFKVYKELPRSLGAHVDEGINSNNTSILNFVAMYRQEHGKAGGAIRSLHLRLDALVATVGTVPTHLAFDYLAPSTWASIGAMAKKLDKIGKALLTQGTHLDAYKAEVKSLMERQVKVS
jgi:hypothetical protein